MHCHSATDSPANTKVSNSVLAAEQLTNTREYTYNKNHA